MKTPVLFSCGHTQDLPLTGNANTIAGKLAHLARRPCHDCHVAQEWLEATEISRGWPPLTGTRRQVEHGFLARARLIPGLQSALYEIGGHGVISDRLRDQTQASWWLIRRFLTADRVLNDLLAEVDAAHVRRPQMIPRAKAPAVRELETVGA